MAKVSTEESNLENNSKKSFLRRIGNFFDNILYFFILFPLSIICVSVIFQVIRYPNEIPNIFGYKLFMILEEGMDSNVDFGDLAFTKNIKPDILNVNDVIAFRNGMNTVTIHGIKEIDENFGQDDKTKEERKIRTFTFYSAINETHDTKSAKDSKVEGLLVHRIPKLGLIIYIIQQPLIIVGIICIILIFGVIAYYIAQRLDLRDEKLAELQEKTQMKS